MAWRCWGGGPPLVPAEGDAEGIGAAVQHPALAPVGHADDIGQVEGGARGGGAALRADLDLARSVLTVASRGLSRKLTASGHGRLVLIPEQPASHGKQTGLAAS